MRGGDVVYALYGQSRAIWAFLTTVIFTEFAAMVVRSPVVMRDMEWDESCLPIVEPRALMFLGQVKLSHFIVVVIIWPQKCWGGDYA